MASLSDQTAQAVLDALQSGEASTYKAACDVAGCTPKQLRSYRLENEHYAETLEAARYGEDAPTKPGPDPKITATLAERILELIETGNTITSSCELAGVSVWTFREYRLKNPAFDEAVRSRKDAQIDMVEDALYLEAMNGSVQAQKFWLINRTRFLPKDHPQKYQNLSKVQHEAAHVHQKYVRDAEEEGDPAEEAPWRYDDPEQLSQVAAIIEQSSVQAREDARSEEPPEEETIQIGGDDA